MLYYINYIIYCYIKLELLYCLTILYCYILLRYIVLYYVVCTITWTYIVNLCNFIIHIYL